MVKNLPAMQETWIWSLGWEDPLEKGMATHCSILTWRSPWTEEPTVDYCHKELEWNDLAQHRMKWSGDQTSGSITSEGKALFYYPPSSIFCLLLRNTHVPSGDFSSSGASGALTLPRTLAAAKSLQSCPTLCDPIDGLLPGSPVPGILQARTQE